MNREQWKERLSLIQAFVDGKEVELKVCGQWMRINASPDFNSKLEDYRIKPEPKLRPWKPEEVPIGGVAIRHNNTQSKPGTILEITGNTIYIWDCGRSFPVSLETLCKNYTHSLDHGKTWLPCGVLE